MRCGQVLRYGVLSVEKSKFNSLFNEVKYKTYLYGINNNCQIPETRMTLTQRNIAIALSLILVGVLLYYFRVIVTYVLIAWVVSTLGQPIMLILWRLRIGKYHIPPSVSAALTLMIFTLIISLFFLTFVPLIVEQANNLSQVDYNSVAKNLEKPLADLTEKGRKFGFINKKETALTVVEHEIISRIKPENINTLFQSVVSTAGDFFVGIFAVLFISFFFLKEQTMFRDFLISVMPKEKEGNMREAIRDTTTLLTRYFSGILLQMIFVLVFMTASMLILGVSNALLIAVFAALINIVPYLGPWLGCIFAVSVTISSNFQTDFYSQTVPLIFKICFTFGLMQFLNDWIVQPLIFSNRVLAHPLEIFLITLIGAKVGGIPGMVLAIPTYTVLRVVAREFFNQFRFVQTITHRLSETDVI